MKLGTDGQYSHPGGGLGGGHRGSGDYSHGGIFFHEQGHAFGIPHTAGWYGEGKFPYPNGGLAGSAWAYDVTRHVMIDVYHHGSLASDHWCKAADSSIPVADNGLCYKQDPMQSGSGMEAGQVYQIYADFNAAHIQRYFEGRTASQGRGFYNEVSGEFETWDPAHGRFVPWERTDIRDTPVSRGVPVVKIVGAINCAELRCASNSTTGVVPALLDTAHLPPRHTTLVYQVLEHVGDAVASVVRRPVSRIAGQQGCGFVAHAPRRAVSSRPAAHALFLGPLFGQDVDDAAALANVSWDDSCTPPPACQPPPSPCHA